MAVLLHDVIPVRHAHGRVRRAGWRAFFKRSTADAAVVLVYSEATAKGAVEVLGLPPTKLCRVRLPVDLAMAGRIRQRRRESKDRWAGMLYVGQVKSHKNLDRALLAYARSRYAAEGGRFTLVASGGPGAECLRALAESRGIPGFLVLPRLTEDELEEAYAGAAFVIQPSLEEGFGLPVVEALAAGIPVCCSSGGAVEEAAAGAAELFEPTSVSSIAAAIDRTAELARAEESSPHPTRFKLPEMATPADFANEIVAAVASR